MGTTKTAVIVIIDQTNMLSGNDAKTLFLNGVVICESNRHVKMDVDVIADNIATALGNCPVDEFKLTPELLGDWMRMAMPKKMVFGAWNGGYAIEFAYGCYLMAKDLAQVEQFNFG